MRRVRTSKTQATRLMLTTIAGTIMMKSTRRRLWVPERLLRVVPTGVQRVGHTGKRLHSGEPGQRDGRTEEDVLDEVLRPGHRSTGDAQMSWLFLALRVPVSTGTPQPHEPFRE